MNPHLSVCKCSKPLIRQISNVSVRKIHVHLRVRIDFRWTLVSKLHCLASVRVRSTSTTIVLGTYLHWVSACPGPIDDT